MPKIVEDFDPTIRRTGSGSGRPQIFHIDLKPLDQVAGKTNQKGDPVFVQYTRNDLDGAADATFQQQVRAYAENMDKGKTKHGYRAVVRTDPLMETDKDGNASPVTDDEGKQVVDFYVAVVPVTDRDIARRKSYAQARANGKEGEDGNETGNAGDESANAASKGKETAKA